MSLESGLTLHVSSHYTNHINRNPSAPLDQSIQPINHRARPILGLRLMQDFVSDDVSTISLISLHCLSLALILPGNHDQNTIMIKYSPGRFSQMGIAWKLW